MPIIENSWSFWLRLSDGAPQPSFEDTKAAIATALPDFDVHFSIAESGGNPRDGYLHSVNMTATNGEGLIKSDLGCFVSFGPQKDEKAKFEIYSFAPWVTSHAPWNAQEAIWHQLAQSFAKLGFVDATMITPQFAERIANLRLQSSP